MSPAENPAGQGEEVSSLELAGDSTPASYGCQWQMVGCRNMRSSSLSNIESSALRACMEHDGIQRGAVDVGKGAGSAQGTARS